MQPTPEQLHRVFLDHFGISPVNDLVNFELILREKNPEAYDRMRTSFEATLVAHPNPDEVLRRSYVGPDYAVHLQGVVPRSEVRGLRSDMTIHYPVCTVAEIRRMQSPKSSEDHLLLLRANTIADNSRLKRVFLKRRERHGEGWSLSAHFNRPQFRRYLATLPKDKRVRCERVPAGFAFLREPNGACMRSDHGDCCGRPKTEPLLKVVPT